MEKPGGTLETLGCFAWREKGRRRAQSRLCRLFTGKERELKATTAVARWVRCQPGAILTCANSLLGPAKGEPALSEGRDAGANMDANTSPPVPGFPLPL